MYEKEFAASPADTKELLREAIAEATGQPAEKIGDGKLLELLAKLLPLFIQFLPLFMADKKDELPRFMADKKDEIERKIGDGTFVAALLAALSNPQFVQNLAGLIALIQSLFPAK